MNSLSYTQLEIGYGKSS